MVSLQAAQPRLVHAHEAYDDWALLEREPVEQLVTWSDEWLV